MSSAQDTLSRPKALTARAFRALDELDELSEAWDDLLAEYPPAATFCTLDWLVSWWCSFGKGRELLVLAWFDSDKRLIGLAPLSISWERFGSFLPLRVMRLMGDGSGDSDNLDLPVRPGFAESVAHQIVDYLKQHSREWDLCQFNTLPTDSLVAPHLLEVLKRDWTFIEHPSPRSAIPLPTVWNDYLEQLSGEDRKNLERYSRRLEKRYATKIYRCASESQLPASLEALFRLHQLRWESAGEPGSFASAARRDFYQRLSRRLLQRGLLELWVMELDGNIAAVQFAFRFGDRVFQLQEGNDPERASDRVGFLLRGEVLKHLIAEGVRVYDFLGGTDPYKTRWGARPGCYRNFHFARSFSKGGAWLLGSHFADRTKEWLRTALPGGAWSFLHRMNLALKGKSHSPTQDQT